MLFKKVVDKNGYVSMQRIAPLKTITKEDKNEIKLDISSQIRQPNEQGYFIGLIGDEKDYIIFNGSNVSIDLSYYGNAASYKPRKVLSIALKDFEGEDMVSNRGRNLEQIEIIADADTRRVWNTVIDDIYPAIAVLQNGGILNEDDSSINIPLKSDDEIFDLHLYKGSLKEENITKITVKAVIDGKLYEDFILLK